MDKSRPRQWTATGEPKVSRVSKIVGERVTRPQIVEALKSANSTPTLRARARAQLAEPVSKPQQLPPADPPLVEPEPPTAKSFLERHRAPHRRDLTVELVIGALTATGGARAAAAQRLHVTRSAISHFIARNPEVEEAIIEIRGTFVDLSEAALIKAARAGEGWAVRYMLDSHGAELGYGRKPMPGSSANDPLHVKPQEQFDYSKLTREQKRTMMELMQIAQSNDADSS